MAYLNPTMDALKAWVSPSTGMKLHPIDDNRRRDFIRALWNHEDTPIDEQQAREIIVSIAKEEHPEWDEEYIQSRADDCVSRAREVTDFLEHVNAPKPI